MSNLHNAFLVLFRDGNIGLRGMPSLLCCDNTAAYDYVTTCSYRWPVHCAHYNDVIVGAMASQITSLTTAYSIVYSGANQRNYQRSASLAFLLGIHRWPVNSPHKWSVTRKMLPFDDVIMPAQRSSLPHHGHRGSRYINHVKGGTWNILAEQAHHPFA